MLSQVLRVSAIIVVSSFLNACGQGDETNDGTGTGEKNSSSTPTKLVGSAEMSVSSSASENENDHFVLENATKCTKNSSAGTLDANFSGTNTTLSIRIRNFTATSKTYTCRQTQNNQSSTTSIGDQFNGCGVEFSVDPDDSNAKNQYASYRRSTAVPPFEFRGECTIEVSDAVHDLRATIACTQLVQTHFDGAARNPIDTAAVATLNATLNCEM